MAMPVQPEFNQSDFRGRTNVTDPVGVNTAFDAGDTAINTNWTQDSNALFRVRFVVKQTVSTAANHNDIITEFALQYNNTTQGSGWQPVGAQGTSAEDVVYEDASGFADGDNTTQVLGSGTFVTGDGVETTPSDSVTFLEEELSETELEFALKIVTSQVSDNDTIQLRVIYSAGNESPPATALQAYDNTPSLTVNKVFVEVSFSPTFGDLLSVDEEPDHIYHHSGISAVLLGSMAVVPAGASRGIAITSTGSLLHSETSNGYIYIHSGLSNVITGSFVQATDVHGIVTDSNDNLISVNDSSNFVFIHDGLSSTITGSFSAPTTQPKDLAIDSNDNLLSTENLSNFIYQHNGITSTLNGSFAGPTSNIFGLTIDKDGNAVTTTITGDPGSIFQHDGLSASVNNTYVSPDGTTAALVAYLLNPPAPAAGVMYIVSDGFTSYTYFV